MSPKREINFVPERFMLSPIDKTHIAFYIKNRTIQVKQFFQFRDHFSREADKLWVSREVGNQPVGKYN